MFRANRLRMEKDFDRVFKHGKGIKNPLIYVKFVKNDLQESRFGFVIGRKVSNKAVVRNAIKRKIKGVLDRRLEKIAKGFDVVFVVSKEVAVKKSAEIEEIVLKALNTAKLYD
jgi:ribonuclease P protein component